MRERVMLTDQKRTLTIGRSVNADVMVDDEHVAPLHASLEITPDGRILATDLGTANGIVVSGKRYHAARDMELSAQELQVGRTRLRIRTAHDVLSPEKLDVFDVSARLHDPAWLATAALLAVGVQLAYSSWLAAPQDLAANIVALFGSAALLLALWVCIWALLSRVMRGEWRWLWHIAISAGALVLYIGADSLLDISMYMFSRPAPERNIAWLGATALGCAVCLHLMYASSLSTRRSAQIATIVALVVLATGYWRFQRPAERDVNYIASSIRLYPPVLPRSAAEPADAYYKSLTGLRDAADKKVKAAIAEDPEPDDVASFEPD